MSKVLNMAGAADDPEWEANRAALLSRLKRVEGQVRGIQAMIERNDECEKVAQQMSAARKALDRSTEIDAADRAARPLALVPVQPDHDGGAVGRFLPAGGNDAYDAGVPAGARRPD